MRAHLVQLDIAWEDRAANHSKVAALLADIDIQSGDLVALPELFDTGFSFNIERTCDTDDATSRFCRGLALERACFVHGSLTAVGPDGRGRNRAVAYGPDGQLLSSYDKIHPFSLGKEHERFSGGDAVTTWWWDAPQAGSLTVCPAICYDLRFPELFRAGLRLGAEAFVIGANWPSSRSAHWRALLLARAIENQAFVLGINRCGRDPALEYAGGSIAVSPTGEILAEADDREQVLTAEIDPGTLRRWRDKFPAWRDLRPEIFGR